MKVSRLKYIAMGAILGLSFVSCEDFLDRPNEDSYNDGNYFQNDAQTKVSVNTLYNSPWYDFLSRGYYKIPEALSGNLLLGGSPYANFTVNGSDEDMKSTSNSLWAVNAQANTIYNRLKTANASESVKNTAMGECLAWKAMAYFYLVRIFGEVPIVHDNSSEIAAGNYNEKYKVKAADIYEYIIMTLEKAIELLPEENQAGRIDKWAAKGLLAKVYLTKSGINANGNGQRDADDLAKAASYAKDVINNSGKQLMANYEDIFKGENDLCEESLFGWRWTAEQNNYTCGNCLTSELAMLAAPETLPMFLRKYQRRQIKQYRRREPVYKGAGDIICCLDESSSTAGECAAWGKAVAMTLLEIAESEGRRFALIHFSDFGTIKTDLFFPKQTTVEDRLRAAETFLDGGTDFCAPLNEALRLMEEKDFENADIVFITDGECVLPPEFISRLQEEQVRRRFTITGILLDQGYAGMDFSLRAFCQSIYRTSELTGEAIVYEMVNDLIQI